MIRKLIVLCLPARTDTSLVGANYVFRDGEVDCGAKVFLYNQFENLTLGSSKSFVTISAAYKVIVRMTICGTQKASSKPIGPVIGIGNASTHWGMCSLYVPLLNPTAA